jgi:hypothetical protein
VECDGGDIYIEFKNPEFRDSHVLMHLNRIRMQECGREDFDDGSGTEVTSGRDDAVFRLDRIE